MSQYPSAMIQLVGVSGVVGVVFHGEFAVCLCSPVLCLLLSLCSLAESYSVLTWLGFSFGWPGVHDLSSGWPLYSIKDGHDSLISEADSLLV